MGAKKTAKSKTLHVQALEAVDDLQMLDEEDVLMCGEFDGRGVAVATNPTYGDLTICVVEDGEESRAIYLNAESVALVRAALRLSELRPTPPRSPD